MFNFGIGQAFRPNLRKGDDDGVRESCGNTVRRTSSELDVEFAEDYNQHLVWVGFNELGGLPGHGVVPGGLGGKAVIGHLAMGAGGCKEALFVRVTTESKLGWHQA